MVSSSTATVHCAPPTAVADLVDRRGRALGLPAARRPYSGETVGYEALARGPRGSRLARPDALFEAARIAGLEREVEWECQRAALQGALDARLPEGQALFVNLEPRLLKADPPEHLGALLDQALERFSVFAEFTERSLTDRPAEVLAAVERLRRRGVGIALDDVGADPRSLALMPFLAPEVIKLDLRLVQENPRARSPRSSTPSAPRPSGQARWCSPRGSRPSSTARPRWRSARATARAGCSAVRASCARPGRCPTARSPRRRARSTRPHASPFEAVTAHRETRRGDKRLLLAAEPADRGAGVEPRIVGRRAQHLPGGALLHARAQPRATRASSEHAALAGALGVGLSEQPAPGVRGVALDRVDPLRGEWDVTVIAPHFAMAFVARELGDDGPDMQRRFDFAMTYDRDLAIAAARALMSRVAGV